MSDRTLHPETLAIRAQADRSAAREHSVPLYLTSSFVFDDAEQARALFADEVSGNVYSRYTNPNVEEFVRKLCLLEGAEAGIATASGMAAVFSTLAAVLSAGDHVVASRALFGANHQVLATLLPRWGITTTFVDSAAPMAEWETAVRPETRLLFVETPSNPGLALADLEMLGALAREHRLHLVVDNCFATPLLQQPLRFGATLVVHSATKFLDGQGRVLGGAVVGRGEAIATIRKFARQTGPALSPFNAWVLSKSLETLAVRMERHTRNALAIARHLQHHDELVAVRYPFLEGHPQYALARAQMTAGGGIVALELAGGLSRARQFIDALGLVSNTANLGDTRSIATHPASTTHAKLSTEEQQAVGITPGLVRIAVGLEHVDDIVADIEQALRQSRLACDSAEPVARTYGAERVS